MATLMKMFISAVLPVLVTGQNVAFNKSVYVDSTLPPYSAALAVDEVFSRASRWISNASATPHWLMVDLGAVYEINQVNLWAGVGGTTYGLCSHTIDIFTLPATSAAVVNTNPNGWATMFSASYGVHFQHTGTAVARFIRVYVEQQFSTSRRCRSNTDARARIIEFQVEGTLAAPTAQLGGIPISNVAVNKPVRADSTLSPYAPSRAVDGNTTDPNSRWISQRASNRYNWLIVDLQQLYTLVRFAIYASPHLPSVYALCSHNISVWNSTAPTTIDAVAAAATSSAGWVVLSRRLGGSTLDGVQHDDILPTRARYVRLSINTTGCNAQSRVAELEAYGTTAILSGPGGTLQNVALYKPVLVDSTLDSRTGYRASNAVDGLTTDQSSRWVSASGSGQHWIAIDLSANYEISAVNLVSDDTAGNRGICRYQIQVWAGDSSALLAPALRSSCGWITISTQSAYSAQSRLHSDFDPVLARFVRVQINQTGCPSPVARVYEVQVYGIEQESTILADGTNSTVSTPILPNVALNRPAIADSVLGNYNAPMAFDNNTVSRTSRWVSSNAQPRHWLAVDLGQLYLIQGVNLVTGWAGSNGLCSHNVSIFMGATTTPLATAVTQTSLWTPVLITTEAIVTIEHSGLSPPVYGQYVMLTVDQTPCGWDNHSRVYEMAVYGTAAPATQTSPSAIPNVALGQNAVASSSLSGLYIPSKAFDGDTTSQSSRWIPARNDLAPWIAVDLANQYYIVGASMVVGWRGSLCLTGLCSYNISIWSGPSSSSLSQATQSTTGWTNAIVNEGYVHATATHTEFPPATSGQYVRLSIDMTSCGNFSGTYARQVLGGIARLFEFEVFGVPVTAAPTRQPTVTPTSTPTTLDPTSTPTRPPTPAPTRTPTQPPSNAPTFAPSPNPTFQPTRAPTARPTQLPTNSPSSAAASSSSPLSASGNGGLLIIVIIAVVVIVVVIAVVAVKKRSSSVEGLQRQDGTVSFNNPLYDSAKPETSATFEGEYVDPSNVQDSEDGGYMDLPMADATTGYMDVNPEADDDNF